MASGYICAWPNCTRAGKYTRTNANGQIVQVCRVHAIPGFPVPLSKADKARGGV